MKDITTLLKIKIEDAKSESVRLLDKIDEIKATLDWNNIKQVEGYHRMLRKLEKVETKLRHMRNALVQIAYSEGNYRIKSSCPELYI